MKFLSLKQQIALPKVRYVVCCKSASSLLYWCIVIVPVLWVLMIFWCRYLKCSLLCTGDRFKLIICVCSLGEMWLLASINHLITRNGMQERKKEADSTVAYITLETSYWIVNGCYAKKIRMSWIIWQIWHSSILPFLFLFIPSFHSPFCSFFVLFISAFPYSFLFISSVLFMSVSFSSFLSCFSFI
jgi:hypothetical protein